MKIDKLPLDAKLVFDNLYVTPSGDAYNFIPAGSPYRKTVRKKDLITKYKPSLDSTGYWAVVYKGKHYRTHRLVAMAFIPNPLSKPHINHIDSDRANCAISNLEWVTASENQKHAYRQGNRKHLQKKVSMFTQSGVFIKTFDSIIQAAEAVGASKQSDRVMISQALRGVNRVKSAFGMKWEYV